MISLGDITCRKTILNMPDRVQHVLLRDQSRIVQLQCRGEEIGAYPFVLEVVIDVHGNIKRQLRLIKQLADLCENRKPSYSQLSWTVEATRHRDALAALDLRMAGRSYRQIAIFLYGEKAVREDWINPDQTMKNRVIRSVKRGTRMMNGGYRTLLA